jgi:hypothetical protein
MGAGGRAKEVMVRIFALTVVLLLAGLPASGGAWAAETWCLRNHGDPPDKPCVSALLDYCLRGLAAGGGVCAREHGGSREVQQERARPERAGRRNDRRDRWN